MVPKIAFRYGVRKSGWHARSPEYLPPEDTATKTGRSRSVPSAVARPAARMIEGVWRILGIKRAPPMTRFAIDMMSSTVTVKTERARRELGYAPVIAVEEGLARLAASSPK